MIGSGREGWVHLGNDREREREREGDSECVNVNVHLCGCVNVHVYESEGVAAKQVQFNDTQYDRAALGGTRTHNTLLTSQRVLFLLSYQCG